jgi:prepilin-type processing-associated H-X9-DG protein
MKRSRKIFLWIAGILLLFTCLGPGWLILETVGFLAFGWIGFLQRVAPQIQIRWDIAASSAVCAVVLVIGSHLFLRWLYRQTGGDGTSPDARRWRWRWTLSGAGLVLLMFSAGIGAIGVVHQTAWLATSPVRLIVEAGRETANRVKCASNLRQIGQAIQLYANDHGGHYPNDLLTILLNEDVTGAVFVCPSSNDVPATGATTRELSDNFNQPNHCSYIFFGKGLSTPIAANRVIAAENLENHGGAGMNILFGDGHVEFENKDEAAKLLATVSPATQPTTLGP